MADGKTHHGRAWDDMGYHGYAWDVNGTARPCAIELNASLTASMLKERLRGTDRAYCSRLATRSPLGCVQRLTNQKGSVRDANR
jgi:hypothetical protein